VICANTQELAAAVPVIRGIFKSARNHVSGADPPGYKRTFICASLAAMAGSG
jgi:hypothetical protein